MTFLCPKDNCTGCAACIGVCNKHAITLVADPNKLGHLFPIINSKLCINCSACQKVCPSLNHVHLRFPQKAFASWALDNSIHMNSTSGGLAYTIAYAFIKEWEGVVYACAIESEKSLQIKHIRVTDCRDLYKIQGSKYVQSYIDGELYKSIKSDLKQNKKVLFVGTPCQVAAAQNIAVSHKDFYSIDIICHGVPSMHQLNNYLQELQVDAISALHFRNSEGTPMALSLQLKNGSIVRKSVGKSSYYAAFLRSLNYRECCYKCSYAQNNRVGDITLGDFWGLGKLRSEAKDKIHGVSVLLCNTEKSFHMKDLIKDQIFYEERPVKEAIEGNRQLRKPSKRGYLHVVYTYLYPRLGYRWASRICTLNVRFHYLILVPIVSKVHTLLSKIFL